MLPEWSMQVCTDIARSESRLKPLAQARSNSPKFKKYTAFTCSGSGCQTACQSDCQLISTLYTSMFPGQANPYLSGTPNCNCCTAGGGVTCNSVTGRIDQLQWQNKWGRVQNAGTVPNDTFCALSSVVNVVGPESGH